MKWLLYLMILLGVWMVPVHGTDVGKLIPVEVIAVSENQGTYTVRTDTEDMGQGRTLADAFDSLEEQASGIIYLDTAEFLVIEAGVQPNALRPYLKDGINVCIAPEEIPLDGIADYLSVHRPDTKLKEAQDVERIPSITYENERYRMNEK